MYKMVFTLKGGLNSLYFNGSLAYYLSEHIKNLLEFICRVSSRSLPVLWKDQSLALISTM